MFNSEGSGTMASMLQAKTINDTGGSTAPTEMISEADGSIDVVAINDAIVSLHISQNIEGTLEVEGVIASDFADKDVKHHTDKASMDNDVADFISELETDSPVGVSQTPDVESTHQSELDTVKKHLDDNFSASTATGTDDFDCDFSQVTECYSAVTDKMCNLTAEELRHIDASYTPATGFTLRKYRRLPEISRDEVLIKVDATTISTRDCLERIRRDNSECLFYRPWVPGHEIVGRVEQAGSNVQHFLHRRVAALLPYGGGCSRYVRVHSKDLIDLPVNDFPTSSEDLIHLVSTYLTAYQCLERAMPVSHIGQTFCGGTDLMRSDSYEFGATSPLFGLSVLITGGGSPVGLALIELALNAGATVYALSHSSYEQDVREKGVNGWYPLCRKEEWTKEWKGEMDVIVDTIGDYDSYTFFYDVMSVQARFVRVNTTSCGKKFIPKQEEYTEDFFSVWQDLKGTSVNKMAIDYNVFDSFLEDKETVKKDLVDLHSMLKSGTIFPKVLSRVGFDQLGKEFEKVGGGANAGIVVVSP